MFDLTTDPTSIALIEAFAAAKKPISAVCHGPCVFLKPKAPNGEPLIAGKTVTGFSNLEEDQVQLSAAMPFMLEDELNKISGGKFVKAAEAWGEKVVVESTNGVGGVLITGQNPASAEGVGKALLKALGL
jgi:putative intracellular protease/amidase